MIALPSPNTGPHELTVTVPCWNCYIDIYANDVVLVCLLSMVNVV